MRECGKNKLSEISGTEKIKLSQISGVGRQQDNSSFSVIRATDHTPRRSGSNNRSTLLTQLHIYNSFPFLTTDDSRNHLLEDRNREIFIDWYPGVISNEVRLYPRSSRMRPQGWEYCSARDLHSHKLVASKEVRLIVVCLVYAIAI